MAEFVLNSTIAEIAQCNERMIKVEGPARSGKTEVLVQRCAYLLEHHIAPERILIEANSNFAAWALRARLVQVAGQAANGVHIASPQQICVDILSTTVAQAATGRVPRLLNNGERKFFLEDMKTLGMKRRRMRNMLDFFFAQWAKLEPEENWTLAGEEADLIAYLRKFLISRGAMLPEEVAYYAARYLQSPNGEEARHAYAYVLADDFQNLSHAEQTALCMLATEQLVVVGNAQQSIALRNQNPCPSGFGEFHIRRHEVEVFSLSEVFGNAEIGAFVNAVAAHNLEQNEVQETHGLTTSMAESTNSVRNYSEGVLPVKWTLPEEEMNNLTRCLRVLADQSNTADAEIAVVVPNKRWARMAQRALKLRGFSCNMAGVAAGLGGDPRSADRCAALKAHTLLNLLANPHDMVAWRSWCGIGNYLTNSDAWARLGEYAEMRGLSLYDALQQASEEADPFLRSEVLVQRFREGQDFIAKNTGRKGFNLLAAVGGTGLPEFACVEQQMCGDEDAEELFALQQQAMLDPYLPEHLAAIRIVTPENLCGQEAKIVVVMGAVDGLMPRRDAFEIVSTNEERARILGADRTAFYSAVSKASQLVVLSHFSKADLELAEQTKMQVVRVKSEHGQRMALLRPSQFIAEGQAALPSIVGGQQLVSELGIE